MFQNLGVTRLEKILNFVDDALSRLDDNISHSEESISRGDSTQGVCEDYIELFKEKMMKVSLLLMFQQLILLLVIYSFHLLSPFYSRRTYVKRQWRAED